MSLAYAIPIAVFDLDQVTGDLTLTHAAGAETYLSFGGTTETREPGEVIFRDDAGNAHARRGRTDRAPIGGQSGHLAEIPTPRVV